MAFGSSPQHRLCEECGTVLDSAKVLRCTKCKACFYCSQACQKRNWKRIHKRVCSTDPALRPFIRVEMAIERALAKQQVRAPKDACCYICLDGEGDGKKLMRGCACRGDSAGFVHLECLAKLAVSKEDTSAWLKGWTTCGNCKQLFTGALGLEMDRRFWRHYRSSQDMNLRYNSTKSLGTRLECRDEVDAANQLLDEASNCVSNGQQLLVLKLSRASMLIENGKKLEGLGLLQASLPEAKAYTSNPSLCGMTLLLIAGVLVDLDRNQEAHEMATELVAFCKAKFGLEDSKTLTALTTYATTCAELGRVEEAKANFEYAITTQTRVLGREHPDTQNTRLRMRGFGFLAASQSPP